MKLFAFSALLLSVMVMTGNSCRVRASGLLLHYLVRAPTVKTDKTPVIILLHGFGSNEQDLFSLADQLPGKFLVISARAPYEIGQDRYAWYHANFSKQPPVVDKDEEEKSRDLIIRLIAQLKEQYHFDNKQVFLVGFSQGAIMSYSLGLTKPDLVKGIAIMSGMIPEEAKPLVAPSYKLRHLNVFISHGINDQVLKIQNARDAKSYLEKLGILPTYKEYAAVHEINKDMLGDLVSWLNKQ